VNKIIVTAMLAVAVAAIVGAPTSAVAQDNPSISPEQELVEKYAPVIYLAEQLESCDPDGEPYAPQSVDLVLDNPDVLLRQLGAQNPVVEVAPSAADLYGRGEGFFLDFPGEALDPGCLYEQDFDRYSDTVTGARESLVYAHIADQADEPDKLAVQYWFYWYFNDWNNKHESDWEGVQLLFDVGTVDEALRVEPTSVGYAQHEGGERADWESSKLDRDGDHPVVYSSRGSHASYYGSALYLGRSAAEGFGCDTTDGPSLRTDPAVVLLPSEVSGPDDDFAWLDYGGRWGERQSGPFNGPFGPTTKQRWTHPVDWHDGLRSGSVVVPTGDSQGDAVVTAFCGVVEAGSDVLVVVQTSPITLVIVLGVLYVVGRWLIRRTAWDSVPRVPLVARRRAGEIIRAAASSYRHRSNVLFAVGVLYIPISIAVGLVVWALRLVPLVGDLIDLAGNENGTSLTIALLAGSLSNTTAFVAVNALVAAHYRLLDDGRDDVSVLEVVRFAWSHARSIVGGFALAALLITVLLLSVIGIPVALWLLVRFQFLAQVVVTEGSDGRASLRRSSQLVKGRWGHTVIVLGLFNLLLGASGLLVGMLLLVVATGIPLWLFSVVITLVFALFVPLAAVGQTLLFGDAVAESRGLTATPFAEPESVTV
jgi:hypothetical protein